MTNKITQTEIERLFRKLFGEKEVKSVRVSERRGSAYYAHYDTVAGQVFLASGAVFDFCLPVPAIGE